MLANLASVNKNKRELVSGAVLEPLLALARDARRLDAAASAPFAWPRAAVLVTTVGGG